MGENVRPCRRLGTLRAIALLLGLAAILGGCGVKASPRPPGVKAAVRGDSAPDCDGCEIPGPDAYPSPSTPTVGAGSAGLPTQKESEEQPTPAGEEGGASGADGDGDGDADADGAAGDGPW